MRSDDEFDNESSVVTRVLLERKTIVSLDYVILVVLSPRLYRHSSIFPVADYD